jgi:hypothetical protein
MKRHIVCTAVLAALAAGAVNSPAGAATTYQMKVPAKGVVISASATPTTPATPTAPVTPPTPAKTAEWALTAPAAFASTIVGAFASVDGTLVVKNTGDASGTPGTPTITGANAADFALGTNGCTAPVAAASSCSVAVRFKPTAAGTRTAQITVGDKSVTLSGVGQAGATDPYYAQVVSLLHMDGPAGAKTTSDQKSNSVTAIGAAGLAAVSKFGPTSLRLGPSFYDQAQYANSSVAEFGSGNFTMEMWVNASATGPRGGALLSHWGIGPSNNAHWILYMDGSLRAMFSTGSGVNLADSTPLPANTWVHLAVTRQGNLFTLWKNGAAVSSQTGAYTLSYNAAKETRFGVWDDSGSYVTGYVDEVRITKGVARYTANFVPPTEAFPNQ